MKDRAVSVKIRVDKGNGQFIENETIMPLWIADHLICECLDWKDRYLMTATELEIFKETESKLKILTKKT